MVVETASLEVDFLVIHPKTMMESKKLGSAGILAIGKLPDPSQGNLRGLVLILLNSWYGSRSLLAPLLLLEFTQF